MQLFWIASIIRERIVKNKQRMEDVYLELRTLFLKETYFNI